MADSTMTDISKMKVVDLRKELKSRGLSYAGDKSELVSRLQAAMSQDDHADINLDSDEIDSDGVLEDEDYKSQTDILDDSAVDTINEELALADQPPPPKPETEPKPQRTLKRKITVSDNKEKSEKPAENKETVAKKIVLNRATSITSTTTKTETVKTEAKPETETPSETKVKLTADMDAKTRLEMRAKRFGLPVKVTDADKKEARKQRFNQNTTDTSISTVKTVGSGVTLTENLDKLKKRAERFGQSVSKIMTDIEQKERLEKRKAKFGNAQ